LANPGDLPFDLLVIPVNLVQRCQELWNPGGGGLELLYLGQ
jgi:hypothetical protein